MKENKTTNLLIICISLLIAFVIIAIVFSIWPGHTFISQIVAALASAMVVSIITLLLLEGQTERETKKDKDSKVFAEKLRIYQQFLSELCIVVKDQKIDDEEEIRLQFQVASIAMHTSEEHILRISEQVKSIIWNIKEGNENKKEMLSQLFDISEIFHNELYNDAVTTDDKKRMRTIQNFHIFLVKQAELNQYDAECKEEIQRAYKEEEKDLSIEDRMVLLKSLIPANGSKQWIYNNTTLVHDFYTKIGARGSYIHSSLNIGMDLTPKNGKLFLTIFSRTWQTSETLKIVQGIGEGNVIKTNKDFDPSRHVLATFDESESNEKIASFISEMLVKIKAYRDENYK